MLTQTTGSWSASCASDSESPSNTHSPNAFTLALFSLKRVRQHFSSPCSTPSLHMHTLPSMMWNTAGSRFAPLSPLLATVSCNSRTDLTNPGSLRSLCSLLTISINCGKLGRPTTAQHQRPCTSQLTKQHDSLHLLTTSNIGAQSWPRCNIACARVTSIQHTSASISQSPDLPQLCDSKAQADCCKQLKSTLLSGPVIAPTCSQPNPPSLQPLLPY